ncbi:MAG: glycerophosphodiester phosphodiesterase [Nocardioidaceae bacterium]
MSGSVMRARGATGILLGVRWLRHSADYPYFDNDGMPLAFAHRGGALTGDNVGLENSMVAFQTAVAHGYRYLETDVHATADGVLVAFHDATLDRTTDGAGTIAELPYADVRSARIDGRAPIPLLDDLLTAWPDVRLNIDCKSASAVEPLVAAINEHRAWDRVCVAAFSSARLLRLRRMLGPRVATSYGTLGVAALRLLPSTWLRAAAAGHGGLAAQVPVRRGRLEIVTPAFVSQAHELGKQVHVWTIDDPAEMVRLLDMGVDALITDRIDALRDVYRARGIWRGADR